MTYYLKYRPQTISELDLKDVRETLEKIVSSGKIPHAFLFAGPRGIGKTSAARILAKVVNCEKNARKLKEPCNKCDQCTSITKGSNLDVVELDAASHRGIDEARNLRDAVKLATARAKNKVYVIDEAHMLTAEASNALLKTLEEPPEHVYFILATTNPEKLTETIRSRATIINFKKANEDEVLRSLKRPVRGEKIKIQKNSLDLIAKHSDGSFRDAVKVLEQLVSEKRSLKAGVIEEFLFQHKAQKVEYLLSLLAEKETKRALEEVERVVERGVSIKRYTEAIIESLRTSLLAKAGIGKDELPEFSKKETVSLIKLITNALYDLPQVFIEQLPLELAIVEWSQVKEIGNDENKSGNSKDESEGVKVIVKKEKVKAKSQGKSNSVKVLTEEVASSVKEVTEEVWKKILAHIKPKNSSTEALLRAAKPMKYDGEVLTLGVYYRFHKERLEEAAHRRLLENVVTNILGSPVKVVCTLTEPIKSQQPRQNAEDVVLTESDSVLTEGEDEDIIKVAKEIFGS